MSTTKAQVTFTLLQCAVLMLLMLQQQQTAMAHNYIVGDEAYWEVPPFPTYYDVWAAHAGPFLMGDTLCKKLSIPPFSENQLHSNSCLTSHICHAIINLPMPMLNAQSTMLSALLSSVYYRTLVVL
jgi:hypothetical protein